MSNKLTFDQLFHAPITREEAATILRRYESLPPYRAAESASAESASAESASAESASAERGDIHRHIAAIMYDVPLERVTPEQRWEAKNLNFKWLYLTNLSFAEAVLRMEEEARVFAAAR